MLRVIGKSMDALHMVFKCPFVEGHYIEALLHQLKVTPNLCTRVHE